MKGDVLFQELVDADGFMRTAAPSGVVVFLFTRSTVETRLFDPAEGERFKDL